VKLRSTILRLVVFVAVCAVFTGYLAFTIGNIQLFQDRYDLEATFDDVTGLLPNDNVKVAGVVVGKVTSIRVERGRAIVGFEVDEEVRLPSDSSASIRWRNLLGQRFVYLYPGTASTVLRDGERIEDTRSVVDLGELFNRLGPIVEAIEPEQVNAFLDAVAAALDGNEEALRSAVDDLARLTAGLAARDDAISRLIENLNTVAGTITSRDAQIRTVLDNLLALATTFREHTDVLDAAVTDLGDVSANMATLLTENRGEIDRIIDSLTTLVQLVGTKLTSLDTTVAGLDEASAAIFRSARNGEFLNQEILCARLGTQVPVVATACDPESAKPGGDGGTGGATSTGSTITRRTTGARAVHDLMTGVGAGR
jgi:phospholipid/cholesterol/gamma-HCH transport system substrate-binding protein